MKRFLLDTHIFLWWLTDDAALGNKVKAKIRDPRNQIFISAATAWEISIKQASGKLEAPEDLDAVVEEERFYPLPISLRHGRAAGRLPSHHRDPFDRMLIAQARLEDLILVTNDADIFKYEVQILSP